jgi:protein-L-isoaspartate(D-aspartate) O-methyltransferase
MEELTNILTERNRLKTPAIIEAFRKIDRADFTPLSEKHRAYYDIPIPIGYGQTISQPSTVVFMLEQLQPQKGDKILDVGFGSGWVTALLAQIVGISGEVYALERIEALKAYGEKNIAKYNFIEKGIAKCFCADGTKGLSTRAPFDKIIVSASAEKIPWPLKEQLKINGRLVIPVLDSIWLIIRKSEDQFDECEFSGFAFVPLVKD